MWTSDTNGKNMRDKNGRNLEIDTDDSVELIEASKLRKCLKSSYRLETEELLENENGKNNSLTFVFRDALDFEKDVLNYARFVTHIDFFFQLK